MTILQVLHGKPVATVKELAEHFHVSDRTIRTVLKELEQEQGRYGSYVVIGDGVLKRINFLAFTDYWKNRKLLREKNARKHVPPYNPQSVAKELGFYGGEIYNGQ